MAEINYMSCDIETYSDVTLKKCGVYKYTESRNFEILLFSYSINGGEVIVIDLVNGEKIPLEVISALSDKTVTKWAFNATFERICLSAWLRRNYPEHFSSYSSNNDTVGNYLDSYSWRCSMIWSAYLGLPLSLEGVGFVLGLQEQKMKEGNDLIRYFCVPCKPTKTNGGRTRNLPKHDMTKWNTFRSYNKRDVEVEMSVQNKLAKYPVPDFIWDEYHLDQRINDRGIAIDMNVVEHAISMHERSKNQLSKEMKKLTNLDNPNSIFQMKQWLTDNGLETDTLGKKAVAEMLKDAPEDLADVLTLRQLLAKTSIKKYQAMQNAVCSDSRARGMFFFYGGNRTGRWAGRIIQLQNLPQNHMPDLKEARNLIKSDNYDALEMLYDSIPEVLSELIRTAFVPKPGYKFIVVDFSAIEARVLSFLTGEQWRIDVFSNNGDIYCASASAMFGVPVEKHGQNSHLRQKGKIAELGLGYGGSVGALIAMGALDMGLAEEELKPLVNAWRTSNPNIVQFWWDVDNAVKTAIKQRTTTETHGIHFIYQSGMLFINLPSGRKLTYVKPKIGTNRFCGESVTYEGIGTTKKWERIESYGSKFVENIVQAISRDILSYAMQTLSDRLICGHVHDELIIECPMNESLDNICAKMGRTPPWMKGLLLRADGYETMFYRKD
ncbi:DNA polymerase [Anaerocolumna sp. MB42-C2]|uniref:DNA polymerase n=1 Tax=Anaerocolumna sp. MB42-C2 TaxID=3070997 RepID=UPI0027DF7F74|nr:DNA polymerase [Anaerocolumna sp. MB42-C2]WMJ87761.1 DNA polymerase [Anaerocolumna sp. MB42-C2]